MTTFKQDKKRKVMDAVTLIVTALVNGFLSELAKDAYNALKGAIHRKYNSTVSINKIEEDPKSIQNQEIVKAELRQVGADTDAEILALASDLLDLVEPPPEPKRKEQLLQNNNPDEILEYTQWNGGRLALKQIFEKHFNDLLKIRDSYSVRNVDLLSGKIASNYQIPREIVNDISKLQNKVRDVIQRTAVFIESKKYSAAEKAIAEMDLAHVDRDKAQAIVLADKKINISYQTLKATVEYFKEINEFLRDRMSRTRSRRVESHLAIGNAILVYELTDYVIKFIEGFSVDGYTELLQLHTTTQKTIEDLRRRQKQLESNVKQENVESKVRIQTLENIRLREESIIVLEREWKDYIESVEILKSDLGKVKLKIPTLSVIREDAKIQIEILQEVEMLRILKQNITIVEATLLTLESIQLIALSPDRVRRLLGIN